jgi:hypothetical protein
MSAPQPNKTRSSAGDPESVAHDLLHGCEQIGAELGVTPRRAYYLLEKGLIPAGKIGATWVASKRKLRDHHDRVTSGEAA